jgi:hypothetical protein
MKCNLAGLAGSSRFSRHANKPTPFHVNKERCLGNECDRGQNQMLFAITRGLPLVDRTLKMREGRLEHNQHLADSFGNHFID